MIISTIVDADKHPYVSKVYEDLIISTIVDAIPQSALDAIVYKDLIISTIVDMPLVVVEYHGL